MKPISILVLFATCFLISGCNEVAQQSTTTESSPAVDDSDAAAYVAESESKELVYGNRFPEVLAVKASPKNDVSMRFDVTLSSTYDSPQRYADAWRVLDADSNELGIRILGHDHASEQPFTRSGTIKIPAGTSKVYVEGRDQANGWSGQRFEVELKLP